LGVSVSLIMCTGGDAVGFSPTVACSLQTRLSTRDFIPLGSALDIEREIDVIKKLVAAAAFVAFGAGSVLAADLAPRPYTKAAPVAEPVYSWTGFYVGAVAGAGRSKLSRDGFYDTNRVQDSFTDTAMTVGGTVGFNYQFAPTWLVGIEGDGNWLETRKHVTCGAGADPFGGCFDSSSLADFNTNWFATIRGRLGYLPDPRVLLYVTGGVAFGEVEYKVDDFFPGGRGSQQQTHTGWAAGAGVEYMIARNWTVKGEYLHVDLGSKTYSPVTGANLAIFTTKITPTFDLVRVGVNYKFGFGTY
jgi:outer membrane immunogenic protein